MKKLVVLLILVFLLFITSGCSRKSGFSVTVEPLADAPQKMAVDGIPFYKKIPIFVQTSIYLDPFYEIKLFVDEGTVDRENKPSLLPAAVSLIAESDLPQCSVFANKVKSLSDINSVIQKFMEIVPSTYQVRGVNYFEDNNENPNLPKLFSNHADAKMVVDWKNLYYINYKVPVVGTSSLKADLGPDGTLTKAEGETTDRTVETILGAVSSFLPIKELLTTALTPAILKGEAGEKEHRRETEVKPVTISIEIEKKVCIYTLTKIHRDWKDGYPAILLSDVSANRVLDVIDLAPIPKNGNNGAPKNALEFSGQITLPAEENQPNE
jgi:hypothetical protein